MYNKECKSLFLDVRKNLLELIGRKRVEIDELMKKYKDGREKLTEEEEKKIKAFKQLEKI